jgi:hypothetical protein
MNNDKVNKVIKKMCSDAFSRVMEAQPILIDDAIDYSNIKNGQYIARIEDDVAITCDKFLLLKDAKINKTED